MILEKPTDVCSSTFKTRDEAQSLLNEIDKVLREKKQLSVMEYCDLTLKHHGTVWTVTDDLDKVKNWGWYSDQRIDFGIAHATDSIGLDVYEVCIPSAMYLIQCQNTETNFNPVSNPSHYCDGRTYEPRKVIADWDLNFYLGCTIKYISRAGRKGDKLEDLKKAAQYLQWEIERLEDSRN